MVIADGHFVSKATKMSPPFLCWLVTLIQYACRDDSYGTVYSGAESSASPVSFLPSFSLLDFTYSQPMEDAVVYALNGVVRPKSMDTAGERQCRNLASRSRAGLVPSAAMGCTASRDMRKLDLHTPQPRRRLPAHDRNIIDGDSQTDSQFATASSYVDITTQEAQCSAYVTDVGKSRRSKIAVSDSKQNNV
ncbi:hypothetical protein LSAT2_021084 [Lamellibrachia satsuma]|nr:hypothetical protein LSAT2_021084 [Lamellibrachia satsuma]